MRSLIPVLTCATVLLAPVERASAQIFELGRPAIEAVASIATSSEDADDPFVFLDLATTMPLNDRLEAIVRPYARRLPGGDWDALFYQAQIRYRPRAGMQLDAGIITSPIGLATLELRPDLNPTVTYPFYYFSRLPLFDEYPNEVQMLSGGYPLGAVLSISGGRWDARAGITDGTPARYRKIFQSDGPDPAVQFVAGGGVTPWIGFRVGGAVARGQYRSGTDNDYYGLSDYQRISSADALVMNIEAEWSYRYTKLSGEWVRDRFETDGAPAVSRAFYVQAVQTLTPRTFAAGRITRASSPVQTETGAARWARTTAEVVGGYRLTPELTLRAGYQANRAFGVDNWQHAAVGSVVWSQRWF